MCTCTHIGRTCWSGSGPLTQHDHDHDHDRDMRYMCRSRQFLYISIYVYIHAQVINLQLSMCMRWLTFNACVDVRTWHAIDIKIHPELERNAKRMHTIAKCKLLRRQRACVSPRHGSAHSEDSRRDGHAASPNHTHTHTHTHTHSHTHMRAPCRTQSPHCLSGSTQ
jgi:hypothetical protein